MPSILDVSLILLSIPVGDTIIVEENVVYRCGNENFEVGGFGSARPINANLSEAADLLFTLPEFNTDSEITVQ